MLHHKPNQKTKTCRQILDKFKLEALKWLFLPIQAIILNKQYLNWFVGIGFSYIPECGKCPKISKTFFFLFSNKIAYHCQNIQNACQNGKQGRPWSDCFFWVCTVCLGMFGRQLMFKILEHLPYILFYVHCLSCVCLVLFLCFTPLSTFTVIDGQS